MTLSFVLPAVRFSRYSRHSEQGVARAARELTAAGYEVIGPNVTIETTTGKRIVADLIAQSPRVKVIIRKRNIRLIGYRDLIWKQ
jgi:fructose-1,6-bisphosphatase